MKRALYFAIIYLASCFVGTLIFATIYMFSCNLTMFVTGLPAQFFSLKAFTAGILLSFPLVCIIIPVLLILYVIRHPGNGLISFVMYVFFVLLSWLLLIPLDLHLLCANELSESDTRITATSSGVFRNEENGVYFYSRIDENNLAEGLFIDTLGYTKSENSVIPFVNHEVKTESAFPYSDILIRDSLRPPELVTYPLSVYESLIISGEYSSAMGFLAWLSFASLGLALLSIYGLQFLSSWKLSNAIAVVVSAIAIVFINYLYYMNIMPGFLKDFSSRLSQYSGIKDPLICIINVILAVLFMIVGIFMKFYRLGDGSILETEE